MDEINKIEIREYVENEAVEILQSRFSNKRWVVRAYNEGGCNYTEVDIIDLIKWVKNNKLDLIKEA